MLVVMVETTADILAIGEVVDKDVDSKMVADGLRADGLSTMLGGVFNVFPFTAFAQNVGLVRFTGIKSRFVVAVAGIILMLLGFIPKLSALVSSIPLPNPSPYLHRRHPHADTPGKRLQRKCVCGERGTKRENKILHLPFISKQMCTTGASLVTSKDVL